MPKLPINVIQHVANADRRVGYCSPEIWYHVNVTTWVRNSLQKHAKSFNTIDFHAIVR